ncbi:hypothetical protein A45J_2625 [hot springs metagenome]|uniref:Conjugal transfer protein TraH n=1 Tax=hot springs metagenome TaxID=433727 RepID=A0A5J4L9V8_9ZZZZ
MKYIKVFVSVFLIVIVIVAPVMADIDSMLDNVVSGIYTQDPGIKKSPSTTTLSGGSMSFRLKNDVLGRPTINFRSPQASISCSGMNLDAGMMSILNLDLFEQMLSQGGASLAWGIMIGLVYSLPGIGESFQKLNEWARDIQKLMQSPCQVGKYIGSQIGAPIGKWVKETLGIEGSEKEAKNTGNDFSQTMKKMLDYIKLEDFYKTYPYAALKRTGMDDDIMALLAGFFGVLDIYLEHNGTKVLPNDPNTKFSEACGGPCSEENVKMSLLVRPTAELFNTLIYGTGENSAKGYRCLASNIGDACSSVIEVDITTTGLVNKISAKLKGDIDSYALGGGSSNSTDIKNYNAMLPQLQGMLKYAANYKKFKPDESKDMKINKTLSEYLSILILYHVFESIYAYVYSAVGSNPANGSQGEIEEYLKQIDKGKVRFNEYAKKIIEDYKLLALSYEQYKATYEQALSQVGKKMGQGAFLQLHTYR